MDNYFDLYEIARDDLDEYETEMSLVSQGARYVILQPHAALASLSLIIVRALLDGSMRQLVKKSIAGAYNTHILFIRDACFFSWKVPAPLPR